MSKWFWIAAAGVVGYFVWSGKKLATSQPKPETKIPAEWLHEGQVPYNEEVALNPEYRVEPETWQYFGTGAFFKEAKRRRQYDFSGVQTNTIDPIYTRSASSGELRLVGDLLPNGTYFPKGASVPLNLQELDPNWDWR